MDAIKRFIRAHRSKLEAQGYKPGQVILFQDHLGKKAHIEPPSYEELGYRRKYSDRVKKRELDHG